MTKQEAERIITEYLKPVFGFALKRCRSTQDAEDLSQDIVLRAYRALLIKDDIKDTGKFIWAIAHNTLSNYYRSAAKSVVGVPIDEVAETVADPDSLLDGEDDTDAIRRLQSEIAYLSALQRRIVIAYYFDHRKQADIAKELSIPLGTVKWHLFEAKKELKRGMDTVRRASELKFNPIKFYSYGFSGSLGTKSVDEFFRQALSQNICYSVRNEAKTLHEIADDLGVSPVYVETEVDFLEKYGLLAEHKGKYVVNFLLEEPTSEFLTLQDNTYKQAAALYANALYDALTESGLLDDPRIFCNHTLPGSNEEKPLRDKNFLLWSLIPYIAANSGESDAEQKIPFEEVATLRPDGAYNIAHATVLPSRLQLPEGYVEMKNWCGPMWNECGDYILWQIDSQWSDRGEVNRVHYPEDAKRILSLYAHEHEWLLPKEDYAWLSERGCIKTWGDYDGMFKTAWKIVVLEDTELRDQLLEIGKAVRAKCRASLGEIKTPYVRASLATIPPHLRKIKEYELQFIFGADGWFLLHCLVTLLACGKLKTPTEEQRKILTTLIVKNK